MNDIVKNAPDRLKKHFIKEKHPKNSIIIMQGTNNEYLYFIEKGRVEIDTITSQGVKYPIAYYGEGESVGVMEIFNTATETKNVEVLADCEIIKIHKKYVFDWMKEDFQFNLYIIGLLEECFRNTNIFMRNVLHMTIKDRVIVSLYKHHQNSSLVSLTKRQLLQETFTQKRSLNRVIEGLIKDGLIAYEDERFKILNDELMTKAEELI